MIHNSIYSQNVKKSSGIADFLVNIYNDNINAGMANWQGGNAQNRKVAKGQLAMGKEAMGKKASALLLVAYCQLRIVH